VCIHSVCVHPNHRRKVDSNSQLISGHRAVASPLIHWFQNRRLLTPVHVKDHVQGVNRLLLIAHDDLLSLYVKVPATLIASRQPSPFHSNPSSETDCRRASQSSARQLSTTVHPLRTLPTSRIVFSCPSAVHHGAPSGYPPTSRIVFSCPMPAEHTPCSHQLSAYIRRPPVVRVCSGALLTSIYVTVGGRD
jgi:hypothetical protein